MSFVPKKHTYNAHINEVVLGVGDKAVTIGGQNVLAFHTFDGEITNAPKIGVELTDAGMAMCTMPGEQKFYEGCATVADMAKRASAMEGASFICLHLEGADPNGENKSVDECVELAKSVADATDMPLVVMGCKNIEKDTELFNKIAEALTGKNILVLSARHDPAGRQRPVHRDEHRLRCRRLRLRVCGLHAGPREGRRPEPVRRHAADAHHHPRVRRHLGREGSDHA